MATMIEVQVTIPFAGGLNADVVQNTFHFLWDASGQPGSTAKTALANRVKNLFDNIYTSTSAYPLANYARPLNTRIKMYDLSDPIPRVPIFDDNVPLGSTTQITATVMPPEVALCISVKAAPVSGVPLASLRGRFFLGAISDTMAAGVLNNQSRPIAAFMTRCLNACSTLAGLSSPGDFIWVVYSKKRGDWHQIVAGWVDNAWDTQRRRGMPASIRDVWP